MYWIALCRFARPLSRPLGCRRSGLSLALAWALLTLSSGLVQAAPIVTPGQLVYQVKPNESFTVEVLFDAELGLPGIQPWPDGLFSVGWQMSFDSTKAMVDSLTVAPELDYFGFLPGANTSVGPGQVEAEGNIDQIAFTPYFGSLLATIDLTNTAMRGDSYTLQLALKQHFPTEQLFLDGNGVVLDDILLFGSARVFVIPEPSSLIGLVLGGLTVLGLGARRRRLGCRVRPNC